MTTTIANLMDLVKAVLVDENADAGKMLADLFDREGDGTTAKFLRENRRAFVLSEQSGDAGTLKEYVTQGTDGLNVSFDGYGLGTMMSGPDAAVIIVELHRGHPRLLAWGDINSDEPTTDEDLSGAAEVLLEREPA